MTSKIQPQTAKTLPPETEKYLNSLRMYIDDKAFTEKVVTLPKLSSSIINRMEKSLESTQTFSKSKKTIRRSSSIHDESKKDLPKNRFLIYDLNNNQSDFTKVEETLESKNQVITNSARVFLQETNEKIVNQALNTILENIFQEKESDKEKNYEKHSKNVHFSDFGLNEKNEDSQWSWFRKKCDSNGIFTLEQKMDYYNLLKQNNMFPWLKEVNKSGKNSTGNAKLKTKPIISIDPVSSQNLAISEKTFSPKTEIDKSPTRAKFVHVDMSTKYLNDLKTKFKILDDSSNSKIYEPFISELAEKSKISKENLGNFEISSNLEKIKIIKKICELGSSNHRFILKDTELSSEKLIVMISRKLIDFKYLTYLNISRSNLGDVGTMYLLYLVDQHSRSLNYLNISYNKIGKNSIEILCTILIRNQIKLTSLSISGNQLSDKVFCDICLSISKNLSLERFWTADNNLGKTSSLIIGTILKFDKKLKFLDLSKNLFQEYVYNIFKGLISNTTLECIYLKENEIDNKDLKSVKATLHLNHTLKEINFDSNRISNQGCSYISDILNVNKSIEIFSILGNKIDSDGVELIQEKQRLSTIKLLSKADFLKQKMGNDPYSIIYEYF